MPHGMLIYITSPQMIGQVYSDQTHLVNSLLNLHFSILDRSVKRKKTLKGGLSPQERE